MWSKGIPMKDFLAPRHEEVLTGIIGALASELAEMMIGMQPSPPHPLVLSHIAEVGMTCSVDVSGAEAGELREGVLAGGLKIALEDTEVALIQFGAAGEAFRPRNGHPESAPFRERAVNKATPITHLFFAKRNANGIAEMPQHLIDVHAAPAPCVAG